MTNVSNTAAHAATALRDAAESTAHTLSGLVGDAQGRLEHLHLPALHVPALHVPAITHRPSRARVAAPWIALAVVVAAIAVAVRMRSSRRAPLQLADDRSERHAA